MSLSCSEHCRARGCLESRQPFWRVEVSRKRRWSEDGALMSQLWNCPTLGCVIIWASTYPYLSSCHVLEALFRELKASWMIQRSIPNHTWWIIRIARIKKKSQKASRGEKEMVLKGMIARQAVAWQPCRMLEYHRAKPADTEGKRLQSKSPAKVTLQWEDAPKKFLDTREQKVKLSFIFSLGNNKREYSRKIREGTKKRENRGSRKQGVQTQNCSQEKPQDHIWAVSSRLEQVRCSGREDPGRMGTARPDTGAVTRVQRVRRKQRGIQVLHGWPKGGELQSTYEAPDSN